MFIVCEGSKYKVVEKKQYTERIILYKCDCCDFYLDKKENKMRKIWVALAYPSQYNEKIIKNYKIIGEKENE